MALVVVPMYEVSRSTTPDVHYFESVRIDRDMKPKVKKALDGK
jgi:hypothetical protein